MTEDDYGAKARALMHKIGGPDAADKLLSGEWVIGKAMAESAAPGRIIGGLLEVVASPVLFPIAERFVARDRFVVDQNGEVPIVYIGEDFATHFLDVIEERATPAALIQYDLVKSAIDQAIFEVLGGKGHARIALAHLFAFLKVACRSKWYFFYVADVHGTLWAVDAYWRDGGWDMEAYSVTYPRGWRGGGCVVSNPISEDEAIA